MNRAGLAIALSIAVVAGIVFGVYAHLDIDIAALFFDRTRALFVAEGQAWGAIARDAAVTAIGLIAVAAGLAGIGNYFWPDRHIPVSGRATLLILLTLAIGPGLVANVLLKDHWARPRPEEITQFGGTEKFRAWWDPRGACPNNCSFIAGEPSGAFSTLAPAVLVPPQWRPLAYAAAIGFGVALGIVRMAAGAHFFTDVVFAGVIIYVIVWLLHGLLYRWRATRDPGESP